MGWIQGVRGKCSSGGAKLGSAGLVAEGAAADIVTNLTVFDGQEENLFDLWHDLGLPRNVLSDYLTAKGGSEVEDRMKNALAGALEGAVGTGLATSVMLSAKIVSNARRIRFESREIGRMAEAASNDPSGKTLGKSRARSVDIDLADFDEELSKVVVNLGESRLQRDGSANLASSSGLVKVVWKHGENSGDAANVTKEDLLNMPRIFREYQPKPERKRGGVSRVWTLIRDDGRRVHYVARFFGDEENPGYRLLTVRILPKNDKRPPSKKRNTSRSGAGR